MASKTVRRVKPFQQDGEFVLMHNALFDMLMRELSASGWKALCAIIRKTRGWQRDSDYIAYTQIMDLTGIKGRATIAQAIRELESRNLIVKGTVNKTLGRHYRLNIELEIELPSSSKIERMSSESELKSSSDSEHTKQTFVKQTRVRKNNKAASNTADKNALALLLELGVESNRKVKGLVKDLVNREPERYTEIIQDTAAYVAKWKGIENKAGAIVGCLGEVLQGLSLYTYEEIKSRRQQHVSTPSDGPDDRTGNDPPGLHD